NQAEREGLRELFSGAFRLFRNPTAHGVVGYSAPEGKAIIGLVDLMLKMLQRAEELPPPGLFPENVEVALVRVEEAIGPGAASRLRTFLGKCLKELGLKPATAKQWIPFKRYALYKLDQWEKPRSHPITVFYLRATDPEYRLQFSTYHYVRVVGFNADWLIKELTGLGFQLVGKNQEPRIDLRIHNDQSFFDTLFELVKRTADELEQTLRQD
ncbi:MAG: hypothetical protein DRJ03_26240, partial [Chloroflexi bacterium]